MACRGTHARASRDHERILPRPFARVSHFRGRLLAPAFLQPFLAYQATHTVTLTLQSETTANWEADDEQWTVPIDVLVPKLSSFGAFPASYAIGVGGFAVHPDVGPSWKLRGAITILLPRARK
jgi:hypothetical protein